MVGAGYIYQMRIISVATLAMRASSVPTASTTESMQNRSEHKGVTVWPLRTADDHRATLAEIESLMAAEADTPEGDRLDVLVSLVEAWEARHVPVDAPDPIAAIVFMMEQKGLSRRDLEPAIGSRARVAEILNRRRALTLPRSGLLAGCSVCRRMCWCQVMICVGLPSGPRR
jgi:HTH-type transcriptional regulator/antitoxin HigA